MNDCTRSFQMPRISGGKNSREPNWFSSSYLLGLWSHQRSVSLLEQNKSSRLSQRCEERRRYRGHMCMDIHTNKPREGCTTWKFRPYLSLLFCSCFPENISAGTREVTESWYDFSTGRSDLSLRRSFLQQLCHRMFVTPDQKGHSSISCVTQAK